MCRELALVSTTQTEIPLPASSCCCHAPIKCARAEASSASTGTHSRSPAKAVMYIFIGPPSSNAVHFFSLTRLCVYIRAQSEDGNNPGVAPGTGGGPPAGAGGVLRRRAPLRSGIAARNFLRHDVPNWHHYRYPLL